MKEFSIVGRLIVPDDLSHQEMLNQLYQMLQSIGFHFAGESKEIKAGAEYIIKGEI